jgi:hypothetical protein
MLAVNRENHIMKKFCPQIERIMYLLGVDKIKELGEIIGEKPGKISMWNSRGEIPKKEILPISQKVGCNPTWLDTGEGPMKNEQSVGDGVKIGDSVEAEVIRGGKVVKEDGPTKALLDEARNHLSFIGANDKRAFWRLTNEIKDVYDVIYKSVSKASGTGE